MSQKIKKKFIDQEVFDDITAEIDGDVSAEAAQRIMADDEIKGDLSNANYKTIQELDDAFTNLDTSYASQDEIDAEAATRAADDATLQSNIDAEAATRAADDATLQSNIDAEQARAEGEELRIEGKVDGNAADIAILNGDSSVEGSVAKAIADVIDMAPEALDTLNELAASIGDDADFAGSVTQQITDAKNELKGSVSEAFDTMEEIEAEFTKLNGDSSVEGSVDYKVAAEQARAEGEESRIEGKVDDNAAAIAAEQARAEGEESRIEGKVDDNAAAIAAEEAARIAGDDALRGVFGGSEAYTTIKALSDAVESLDTGSSDSIANLQAELDATQTGAGLQDDGSYVADGGSFFIQSALSLKAADSALDAALGQEVLNRQDSDSLLQNAINAEQARAEGEELRIEGKVDGNAADIAILNGDSSVEGSVAKAIADVVGAAPEALDTLEEIAASLANDPNLDSTLRTLIDTNIDNAKNELKGSVSEAFDTMEEIEAEFTKLNGDSSVEGSVDYKVAAEQARAEAAEAALDGRVTTLEGEMDSAEGRLDALEAVVWIKEKFVLGTDAGATEVGGVWSVALSQSPVSGSESVFVGRLAMHDEDYSVSGSDVSFDGTALVDGGEQDLVAGDVVYVKYQYQS